MCDPADKGYTGCDYAAEWGSLYGRVQTTHHLGRSPTGTATATAAPVGGDALERWIITTCVNVNFRAYAPYSMSADTDFCLTGQGEPGRPECASWATALVRNNGHNGDAEGAWCGIGYCDGSTVGTADKSVTLSVTQPGGRNVPVRGIATAVYQEDKNRDGNWEDDAPHSFAQDDQGVTFRIGSTPF